MDIGMGEIMLILLVALLIYGGRLPEVARSLGRAIATVKRNLQESTAEVTRGIGAIDAPEDRPRTVRRAAVAPPAESPAISPVTSSEALATEDVSGEAPTADAAAPKPTEPPKPPERPGDAPANSAV